MQENTSFHEKQYLGYSKYSNLRRIILALFFFIAYYFSKPGLESTNLLFYLGSGTLLLSGVLMYVLHLETTLSNGSLIFDGSVEIHVFKSLGLISGTILDNLT